MDANAFRQLYNYHFTENRKLWNCHIAPLSQLQFTKHIAYSKGSLCNQITHLIDVDEIWFCELQGILPPEPVPNADDSDRHMLRERWDSVEQQMLKYLDGLRNDMLFDQPIKEPAEDKLLRVWQVLLHVVNHGTDHRAQILRALNELGLETTSQDLIFHLHNTL